MMEVKVRRLEGGVICFCLWKRPAIRNYGKSLGTMSSAVMTSQYGEMLCFVICKLHKIEAIDGA